MTIRRNLPLDGGEAVTELGRLAWAPFRGVGRTDAFLRRQVLTGNAAPLANPAFGAELKLQMRFNPRAALATGDGFFSVCHGNPCLSDRIGPPMLDREFNGKAENARYANQSAASAGIAVSVAVSPDPAHCVLAGRTGKRSALQTTALGLKHAFLNLPVKEPDLHAGLAALFGFPGRWPDILMRFKRAAALPFSARQTVEAVVV